MRQPRSTGRRASRRGLTLVELIIGLTVTSMTLLALTSFTAAVSTGWARTKETGGVETTAVRSSAQVDQVLRNALALVQRRAATPSDASSYLFLWKCDGFGGIDDGVAQVGEMALLAYEPTRSTVWLYEAYDTSAMSAAQLIDAATSSWGDLSSPAVVEAFKGRSSITRRAIVGPGESATSTVPRVTAATFDLTSVASGAGPVARYSLTVAAVTSGRAVASTLSGSIAIRNPTWPSNGGAQP